MSEARKLTFEQCMRLLESLECPPDIAKQERTKLLEWAEKILLDYWTLCQMMAGTIQARVEADGNVSFNMIEGKLPIKLPEWPPKIGTEKLEKEPAPEKSGLYTSIWSGEHKAASLSGEFSTDWLKQHPEARPRPRIIM